MPLTFRHMRQRKQATPYPLQKTVVLIFYLCQVIDDKEYPSPSDLKASSVSPKKLIPDSAYDWCRPECVTEQGNAAKTILKLALRVSADLIVLGVRRSSFWLTYVDTGVAAAVLSEARCPVLTIC
jgi:nucleotide-binding universal stress UspA family protein